MSLSKTIYAALIVAATSTASYAQKCQFDVDKTDPISHVAFRSVKYDINPIGSFRSTMIEQKGTKYYMTFEITQPGKVDVPMVKGMEVLLYQQSGKKVMLLSDQDYAPSFQTTAGTVTTTWTARCEVSKNELSAISLSPVIMYHSDFARREMKQNAGNEGIKIQQTAKCML